MYIEFVFPIQKEVFMELSVQKTGWTDPGQVPVWGLGNNTGDVPEVQNFLKHSGSTRNEIVKYKMTDDPCPNPLPKFQCTTTLKPNS